MLDQLDCEEMLMDNFYVINKVLSDDGKLLAIVFDETHKRYGFLKWDDSACSVRRMDKEVAWFQTLSDLLNFLDKDEFNKLTGLFKFLEDE